MWKSHSPSCTIPVDASVTDIEVRKALGDFIVVSKDVVRLFYFRLFIVLMFCGLKLALLAFRLHINTVKSKGPNNNNAMFAFLYWKAVDDRNEQQNSKRRDYLVFSDCHLVNECDIWSEEEVKKRGLQLSSIQDGFVRIFIRVQYRGEDGQVRDLPIVRDYGYPPGFRNCHVPEQDVLVQRIKSFLPSTGTNVLPAELCILPETTSCTS